MTSAQPEYTEQKCQKVLAAAAQELEADDKVTVYLLDCLAVRPT